MGGGVSRSIQIPKGLFFDRQAKWTDQRRKVEVLDDEIEYDGSDLDHQAIDLLSQNGCDEDATIQKTKVPKSDEIRMLIASAITQNILFESLTNQQIDDVIDVFAPVKCNLGDIIINQGQSGDFM
jgi:hypothetical protein